jgi:hypothetical protein
MLKRLFIVAVAVPLLGGYFTFAADLPEVVYQKYLAAIKAKNLGELNKYLSMQQRDKLNAETPEDRNKMIELIAAFMPKSIRVVEVIISSDNKSGTLKLAGTGGISGNDKVYGTVSMLREESGWKINRDEWSNKQH